MCSPCSQRNKPSALKTGGCSPLPGESCSRPFSAKNGAVLSIHHSKRPRPLCVVISLRNRERAASRSVIPAVIIPIRQQTALTAPHGTAVALAAIASARRTAVAQQNNQDDKNAHADARPGENADPIDLTVAASRLPGRQQAHSADVADARQLQTAFLPAGGGGLAARLRALRRGRAGACLSLRRNGSSAGSRGALCLGRAARNGGSGAARSRSRAARGRRLAARSRRLAAGCGRLAARGRGFAAHYGSLTGNYRGNDGLLRLRRSKRQSSTAQKPRHQNGADHPYQRKETIPFTVFHHVETLSCRPKQAACLRRMNRGAYGNRYVGGPRTNAPAR